MIHCQLAAIFQLRAGHAKSIRPCAMNLFNIILFQ